MNPDTKNSNLVQIPMLLKKFEEFLYLRNKSHTHQEEKSYLFIPFLFRSTSKNKKVTENVIHISRKVILL